MREKTSLWEKAFLLLEPKLSHSALCSRLYFTRGSSISHGGFLSKLKWNITKSFKSIIEKDQLMHLSVNLDTSMITLNQLSNRHASTESKDKWLQNKTNSRPRKITKFLQVPSNANELGDQLLIDPP